MLTEDNHAYHGEHFVAYVIVKSLYYTPETNIILYTSIKNKLIF